jgi:S1-C subfamily serine protease
MSRILPALVLAVLASTPLQAITPWTAIVQQLEKSVVYIEHEKGACTGFVINTAKRYYLTAAHCDSETPQARLLIDGETGSVVYKDTKKDLMVVEVKNLDRPALVIAKKDPARGDEVASFGYGYALERPMLRVAHVSDDETHIPYDGIGGPFLVIDMAFVGGQSGGPVINQAGEVVLIVQRGTDRVGIGVGAEIIRDKVGRYLPAGQ